MADSIKIIYEDDDVVVINKPVGLVVHADGRTEEKTLVDWILKKYPKMKEVGEPITLTSGEIIWRPGIVHRLDRDTSGVMIIAKDQASFEYLKRSFQEHTIEKTYRAFVYGVMKEDDGRIDRPITRSRKDFRLWSAQRGGRGEAREAVTDFKVIGRGTDVSYVEAMPKTGRTHQIRVHFKAINHPIIMDRLYAPKREALLGFERLALHAFKLKLTLPSEKEMVFEAPLPVDFKRAEDLMEVA